MTSHYSKKVREDSATTAWKAGKNQNVTYTRKGRERSDTTYRNWKGLAYTTKRQERPSHQHMKVKEGPATNT